MSPILLHWTHHTHAMESARNRDQAEHVLACWLIIDLCIQEVLNEYYTTTINRSVYLSLTSAILTLFDLSMPPTEDQKRKE